MNIKKHFILPGIIGFATVATVPVVIDGVDCVKVIDGFLLVSPNLSNICFATL